MPMYLIEEEGKKTGVVKAVSSSAAIRIATADRFTATNIKTAEEYADLMGEGVPIIVEKPDAPADGAGETTAEGNGEGEQQPNDPPADVDQDETQREGADA